MIVALTREPARDMSACELTQLARRPIDAGHAAAQHRAYRDALAASGARVVALPPVEEMPDSVFVEDTAIVLDDVAVITQLGVASRRAEVQAIEPEVARLRPIVKIQPPATIEGGDVLRAGRTLYVGLSPRTNREGVESLRSLVAPYGYDVVEVGLRDCLHLKTGCGSVAEGVILANPDWVDIGVFRNHEVVAVPAEEPWAANVLRVGGSLLVGAAFPRTVSMLARRGCDVRAVDVSEFAKAEGGLTCLSLIFQEP